MRRGNFLRLKSKRGQASLLLGMMVLTFLLFFAFVVNTGMLVNAKINLQNAADLAAYAGAATQARNLDKIALLNYEMRREYKKFLFRYYVLGNMNQPDFPLGTPPTSKFAPYQWTQGEGTTRVDLKVPVVCFSRNLASRDNYCQLSSLPPIATPPGNPTDPISLVLKNQLRQLENLRQENCASGGKLNYMALSLWIWNTDPTLANIQTALGSGDPELASLIQNLRALSGGIGLVPKQLLLYRRIKVLEELLNTPARQGVTSAEVEAALGSPEPIGYERTSQAYISAFQTLGEYSFDQTSSIVMDELMPSKVIELKPVRAENGLNTFAVESRVDSASGRCDNKVLFSVPVFGTVLGVEKDPQYLTYYAIRLRAKAKLLFSPFRPADVSLEAYAAAQPFGSRIGPTASESFAKPGFWNWVGAASNVPSCAVNIFCPKDVPNALISEAGGSISFRQAYALHHYYRQMNSTASGAIDLGADYPRALHAAMAPNPAEAEWYMIPNDFDRRNTSPPLDTSALRNPASGDPMSKFFDNDARAYPIYAPLGLRDQNPDDVKNDLREMINRVDFSQGQSVGGTSSQIPSQFKDTIVDSLDGYLSGLRAGTLGDQGETYEIYQIYDPFYARATAGAAGNLIPLPDDLLLKDIGQIRNSWADLRSEEVGARGRTGYSVKLVSFRSLRNPGAQSTTVGAGSAPVPWINGPTDDGSAEIPH